MNDQDKYFGTVKMSLAAYEAAYDGLDNQGICLACHAEAYGVEPDARQYECEGCGEPAVYGLEEALIMGALTLT